MQNQFTSLNTKKEQQTSSIIGLSEEYDSILSFNQIMQKEMGDLSRLTEKFENMSLPIRMIQVAFNSNSNLRNLHLFLRNGCEKIMPRLNLPLGI